MSRGVYRGIYSSLPDDVDFQRLTPNARLVLYTARLCAQAGPAAIFRFYPEVLQRQTGLTARQLESALKELEQPPDSAPPWILREGVVLWVRNGLKHDPHLRLADKKHLAGVQRAISALPRLNIVLRFCEYYKIARPFEDPPEALARPCEGVARLGSPSTRPRPSMSMSTNTEKETTAERQVERLKVGQGRNGPTALADVLPRALPKRTRRSAAELADLKGDALKAEVARMAAEQNEPPGEPPPPPPAEASW